MTKIPIFKTCQSSSFVLLKYQTRVLCSRMLKKMCGFVLLTLFFVLFTSFRPVSKVFIGIEWDINSTLKYAVEIEALI